MDMGEWRQETNLPFPTVLTSQHHSAFRVGEIAWLVYLRGIMVKDGGRLCAVSQSGFKDMKMHAIRGGDRHLRDCAVLYCSSLHL